MGKGGRFATGVAVVGIATGLCGTGVPAGAATGDALQPGSGLTLTVADGFLRIRENSFDLQDVGRAPQCSDGTSNDGGQDAAVDFPSDPQCTSGEDDSEVQGGFQPKVAMRFGDGTIGADGVVTFPVGSIVMPPQYLWVDAPAPVNPFVTTILLLPTQDATGTLDPSTGEMSLRVRFRMALAGGPLASGCSIGSSSEPIDVNALTTGTTAPPGPNTPISGTPLHPDSGAVHLVANAFGVPAASGCGTYALFVDLNDQINSNLGLPAPAGTNEMQLKAVAEGAPKPDPIASFTTTPAGGPAPLAVAFDGSSSTGDALLFAWDFTDDGTFDATGATASTTYTTPGTATVRLRVTDADGRTAETTRSVLVEQPLDDDPPETTIASGPSGLTADTTPTFAFTADEPAAFACSVDTGTPVWTSCSGPGATHTAGPLPSGAYVFRVRATDQAGNTDPVPATTSFRVCAGANGKALQKLEPRLRGISPALADRVAARVCR